MSQMSGDDVAYYAVWCSVLYKVLNDRTAFRTCIAWAVKAYAGTILWHEGVRIRLHLLISLPLY